MQKDNKNNLETTFAFDIGTASIGWAVVKQPIERDINYDEQTGEVFNNIKIVASGVRMFNEPVVPKGGELLNVTRRANRLLRRRTRRLAQRKQAIKKMLLSLGYYKAEDFDHYLENGEINYDSVFQKIITENNKEASKYNIFSLRVKALDYQLTQNELAVVLFNLAKTRGFKSSKKQRPNEEETAQIEKDVKDKKDKEAGAVLSAIKNMKIKQMEVKEKYGKDFRTFAELIHFLNSINEKNSYRNKGSDYSNSILRSNVEEETKLIFAKQREFYKELTINFEDKFLDTMRHQRPIKFNLDSVGKCTYLKDENRASKSCFSAEYYTSLGRLINLRINPAKGKERSLEKQEIESILADKLKTFSNLTYKQLRKILGLAKEDQFKGLSYDDETHKNKNYSDHKIEDDKKKLIINFEETKEVDKYLESLVKENKLSKENYEFITNKDNYKVLDQIVQLNSLYNQEDIIKQIEKNENLKNLHQEIKDAIIYCNLSFTTYLQLSLKAMYLIIPYMEELYPKAEAGGIKTDAEDKATRWESKRVIDKLIEEGLFKKIEPKKYDKLPSIAEIEKLGDFYIPNHAVIKRALTQVIKTFNAMVNKYGKPDLVNIELLRELKSPSGKSKHIKKREDNTIEREQARQECKDIGLSDSETNILKVRLWKEQVHVCPYCVTGISQTDLGNEGELQIDHIIPESKSFDNSYNNKVLVHDKCNQNKGQKTPYLYLGEGQDWEKLKNYVYSSSLSKYKKDKLLNTKTLEKITEGFVERQKNDSAYITVLIKDFINNYFSFPQSKKTNHVYATKGALTSILREIFSLKKYRTYSDLQEDKGRFLYSEIVWNNEINPELVEELNLLKKDINKAKSSKDEKLYEELNKKFNSIREAFINYLANYFADVKNNNEEDDDYENEEEKSTEKRTIKSPPPEIIKKYVNDNKFSSYLTKVKVNNTFAEKFKEMEKDFIGDKHHAMDAILVGLLNASVIKQIGTFAKIADEKIEKKAKSLPKEHKDTKKLWKLHLSGSVSKKIQYLLQEQDFVSDKLNIDNLPKFKEEIWESLDKIFISRQPNRKVSGRIHEDTIYSASKQKNEKGDLRITKRINVTKDMKLKAIDEMVDNNIPLKNAIKDWLNSKDENKEPFPRMPTKNGNLGAFIRKITVLTGDSGDAYYKVRGGLVDSDKKIRSDVFKIKEVNKKGITQYKYALRPISLADIIIKKEVPLKLTGNFGYLDSEQGGENQEFMFSLYPNDLFCFKKDEKSEPEYAYYIGYTTRDNQIEYIDHNKLEKYKSKSGRLFVSIASLHELKKAQADLLGNKSIVKNNNYEDFSSLIAKIHKKED